MTTVEARSSCVNQVRSDIGLDYSSNEDCNEKFSMLDVGMEAADVGGIGKRVHSF